MPMFPNYEWLTVSRDHVTLCKFFLECSYLQVLEGTVDTAHVGFLYRGNPGVRQLNDVSPGSYDINRNAVRRQGGCREKFGTG